MSIEPYDRLRGSRCDGCRQLGAGRPHMICTSADGSESMPLTAISVGKGRHGQRSPRTWQSAWLASPHKPEPEVDMKEGRRVARSLAAAVR